jgi:heat shock protein HtpX
MLDSMIASNRRRAALLMAAIVVLLGSVCYAAYLYLGLGTTYLAPLGLLTCISPWLAYYNSHRIVIAASGALDADPVAFKQLHNVVEELSIASGLPKPRVMIVDDTAPNAFATGRNPEHGVIAVTTGLLEKMDREQLEAIIGHELAHIANRDILVGTLAASLTGLVMFLADISLRVGSGGRKRNSDGGPVMLIIALAVLILAPIGALLLRASVSRRREWLADVSSAELTRNPAGMRRALESLAKDSTQISRVSPSTSALWIEEPNPREGAISWMTKMYATHPPLHERIDAMKRLEQS